MKHVERTDYLKTLKKLKDTDLIKVITGVRRSGKSSLLTDFCNELRIEVPSPRLQSYNFESRETYEHRNWTEIYDEITSKLEKGSKNYIFLDEVQNISGFERLLDSLYVNKDIDLYVTGSNAYLLSSELATLLTGRSYNINVLPFSFKEFYETYDEPRDRSRIFADYMNYSSLPQAVNLLHTDESLVGNYVNEVYSSIFENDIFPKHLISSERNFENVTNFIMDSLGSPVSPNKIATRLSENHKKIDSRTVESYLKYLTDSYLLYRARRYDIKGRELLATQEKYYLVDLGFRNFLLGRETGADYGKLLENVIYLELLRRGKEIYVGKSGTREVDFVAKSQTGMIEYYQVALSVRDETTLSRELASLKKIDDHYPKYLITLDPEEILHSGIRQLNAINFLLGDDKFRNFL